MYIGQPATGQEMSGCGFSFNLTLVAWLRVAPGEAGRYRTLTESLFAGHPGHARMSCMLVESQ